MIDLAARHRRVAEQSEHLAIETLRSGQYAYGDLVAKAEVLFAERFQRQHACGVASGTDALILGLMALGVVPGDEVIVPALSFFATAGAVLSLGATPIVVDVLEDGCMDPDATQEALNERTKAIIPVHLYGNYARLPDFGIPILDDSAQAIGGTPPRSLGQLTAVSVYPTKTLGSAGSGGFVVGDDPELIDRVRRLGRHGYCPKTGKHHRVGSHIGRNSRLDAIQAAVLLAHDEDLDRRVRRRQQTAEYYDQHLPPGVRSLDRHDGSPVHQYIILCDERDHLERALADHAIETRRYYAHPLHHEPALSGDFNCPVADRLCRQLLAIPIHAELTDADVERVAQTLAVCMGSYVG